MSYKVGQFKRTSLSITSYQNKELENFKGLEDQKNIIKYDFKANTIYRLCGTVASKNNTGNKIRIKLTDATNKDKYQIITTYLKNNNGTFIDIYFIPKYDFTQITLEDVNNSNSNGFFYMQTLELYKITNLIGNEATKIPSPLRQIGIQGPASLTFIINGEKIQMGKSGVYMSNEMEIDSIGFCIDKSSKLGNIDLNNRIDQRAPFYYPDEYAFFIMDYKY